MDFFEMVERQLRLPRDEAAQVMKELRDHYQDIKDDLMSSGMSDEDAAQEAIQRLGDPAQLAAQLRVAHCGSTWCNLFPPKDFIATSVFFGPWAGGVLAGINFIRLGRRRHGICVILLSVLAEAAVLLTFSYFRRFASGGFLTSGTDPQFGMLEIHINVPWVLFTGALLAINSSAGYVLFRLQRNLYSEWAATHPPRIQESPYLAWRVSLLAIIGAIVTVFFVGMIWLSAH